MGHWNHRLCKETTVYNYGDGPEHTSVLYDIREVYYNDSGGVVGITENGMVPSGCVEDEDDTVADAIGEVKITLERMMLALNKPTIDLDTIEYEVLDEMDEDVQEIPNKA